MVEAKTQASFWVTKGYVKTPVMYLGDRCWG